MRLYLFLVLALCLSVELTSAQDGGLFSSIRNFFRPRRQNQFQPQVQPNPQNFQPPFNPPRQSTRGQFNQPPQQQFQQQQFQQQPQQFQQQPQQFQQQPQQFQQQPQQNRFQPPQQQQFQAPANNFQSQNNNHQLANIPSSFNTCHRREASPANCPPPPPNHQYHFWNNKRYLLTWNISCTNCECSKFTSDEARDYCHSIGMRPVSLDNPAKIEEFLRVSAVHAQRYYWTGGRLQYPDLSIRWDNGNVQPFNPNQIGQHPWSHTGGWEESPKARGQPDNRNQLRDNCEPEFCIGVLNNFYADGIKWHDVACHHRKPTICE